jgi:hypothetical protein
VNESPERVEQFKKDIAEMQVRDPAAGRDRLALRGGFTLMIIGIIVTIAAYLQSHNSNLPMEQTDYLIVALIGIAVTIMGAALFLRGSLAAFFRFWLARLIYEQKAQTDRIVNR